MPGGTPEVTIGRSGCTVVGISGFAVPKLVVSIGCSLAQSTDIVVPGHAIQVVQNQIYSDVFNDSWNRYKFRNIISWKFKGGTLN